jgi:hypothetical protein
MSYDHQYCNLILPLCLRSTYSLRASHAQPKLSYTSPPIQSAAVRTRRAHCYPNAIDALHDHRITPGGLLAIFVVVLAAGLLEIIVVLVVFVVVFSGEGGCAEEGDVEEEEEEVGETHGEVEKKVSSRKGLDWWLEMLVGWVVWCGR